MLKNKNTLYCFSPPVMIATFAVETGLAMYTIWKYRTWMLSRLVVAVLGCLAIFQLAEYMVCQGALGMSSIDWARLGFVSLSFLPPLGFHVASELTGRPVGRNVQAGYVLAAVFSSYFLLSTQGIGGSICAGNYVIFHLAPHAVKAFTLYYYSFLVLGLVLSVKWSRAAKDLHTASALKGLGTGYATFMVPTVAANIVNPSTVAGVPSIMCGFAVTLAFVLVFWVLPQHVQSRAVRQSTTSRARRKSAI